MAIAAIVLHSLGSLRELERSLQALPWIVETKQIPPSKIAATLESPSEKIMEHLQKTGELPLVGDLELVYANYEEDMDIDGHMNCPPQHSTKGKYHK